MNASDCLASTGTNFVLLVAFSLVVVGLGVAAVRYSKARVLLVIALLGVGALAFSMSTARPASAACVPVTTTTMAPTTTTTAAPALSLSGAIVGLPTRADQSNCNQVLTAEDGSQTTCVGPSPYMSLSSYTTTTADQITSLTFLNTSTLQTITAQLDPTISVGTACSSSLCNAAGQFENFGFTGHVGFTVPGITPGTWAVIITWNISGWLENPSLAGNGAVFPSYANGHGPGGMSIDGGAISQPTGGSTVPNWCLGSTAQYSVTVPNDQASHTLEIGAGFTSPYHC